MAIKIKVLKEVPQSYYLFHFRMIAD